MMSESSYAMQIAERQLEMLDGHIEQSRPYQDDPEAFELEQRSRQYRRYLGLVPSEIEIASVDACARPRMVRLRQMALEAAVQ